MKFLKSHFDYKTWLLEKENRHFILKIAILCLISKALYAFLVGELFYKVSMLFSNFLYFFVLFFFFYIFLMACFYFEISFFEKDLDVKIFIVGMLGFLFPYLLYLPLGLISFFIPVSVVNTLSLLIELTVLFLQLYLLAKITLLSKWKVFLIWILPFVTVILFVIYNIFYLLKIFLG